MGLASKLSAAVASIPDPVLGGLLVFCFANILLSGVHILGSGEASRRQRFVSAFALGIGVSVALVPSVVTNTLLSDPPDETPPGGVGESSAERILSVSMQMFFSTPYCVGTAVAMLLHALLPSEAPDAESRTPSATGATGSAEHFDHQSQFDHHSGGDSVGPSAGERERDSAEPVAHEPQLGGQPRGGSVGPAAEGRDKDASGGVDHQPLMVKIDGQTLLDGQIAVEGPKKRLPSGGDRGARAIPPVDASGNDGQISRNDGQTARNDGQNDARGPPKISGDHQADWW
ncbi:hypothetical protein T484DRAFT_2969206 [Baffinella frigidus]|nr:hypothetical protein T484DRAFT_2969206 [Cryptophyta sp. CCMP2293]